MLVILTHQFLDVTSQYRFFSSGAENKVIEKARKTNGQITMAKTKQKIEIVVDDAARTVTDEGRREWHGVHLPMLIETNGHSVHYINLYSV